MFGEVSTASVRVFPRGSKNQGTDEVQDVNFDRFSMAPEMLLFRPPLATLATRWFAGLEAWCLGFAVANGFV